MAFKIGFNTSSKAKKPLAGSRALFIEDDEDETLQDNVQEVGGLRASQFGSSKLSQDSGDLPNRPNLKAKSRDGHTISHIANLSAQRSNLKTVEDALEIDSAIYDYDAAFDIIHAKDAARKAERQKEAEERKSKYMENFVAAAELRKQDLTRAKDKELQREREAEGDMYADKEKFVTGAYKKQQEELRKAEEEEKRRQEKEEEKRKATGMQGFYRNVMEDQEKRYQDAVDAAEEASRSGKAVLVEQEKEKTDAEIAQELRAQGKDVLLNDEGQIVDKRETLSAGLNIVKKSKPTDGQKSDSKITVQPVWQKKGGPDLKAMRERQSRMMEEQLEQAAKRAADEEAEEQRRLEHAAKSQKTETDISSAKERYLARKRAADEAKKKKK